MKIEKRYRIETGAPKRIKIVLVGCGGTGSFLALHLARLAYHARDRHNLPVHLTFIDPDLVELRNIGRQNFAPVEIGEYKAWSLMHRFNRAFGLDIHTAVEFFHHELLPPERRDDLRILIGCVDNAPARRDIHHALAEGYGYSAWWLDCGNHEHAGQVLLGNRRDLTAPEIDPLGVCSGLPLPTIQHPELLAGEPETEEAGASCADLALADVQSLMINQAVATYAAQYIYRLVLARDLDIYATYIDLITGSARSLPITDAGKTS